MTVQYLEGTTDVTADVVGGTYDPTFNAAGLITLKVRVTIGTGTPKGSVFRLVVTTASLSDPSKVDVVRIVAKR